MVTGMLKSAATVGILLVLFPVSAAAADGVGVPGGTTPTPTAGVCVVSGTATFSPGVNIVPQTIGVSINVGGTCNGDPVSDSMSLTISGGPLLSCEAGFGPTSDVVSFADNPPGLQSGTGDLVVTAGGGVATVTAGIVVGTLTYVWTGSPLGCTAPSGVTSTGVTGLFTYVSE